MMNDSRPCDRETDIEVHRGAPHNDFSRPDAGRKGDETHFKS